MNTIWAVALALTLAVVSYDLVADGGNTGYEGQPGNQAGNTGGGLQGYEGQPGNQGGNNGNNGGNGLSGYEGQPGNQGG